MDVSKIKNTILFRGMSEKEISDALEGLRAVTKKYKKGATILHAGSVTKRMGLVLEGSVTIENNDVSARTSSSRKHTDCLQMSLCS